MTTPWWQPMLMLFVEIRPYGGLLWLYWNVLVQTRLWLSFNDFFNSFMPLSTVCISASMSDHDTEMILKESASASLESIVMEKHNHKNKTEHMFG